MALAYLLSPTFEIVNSAGKPATGGYIETYVAGSRTKYFCASDFDGTRHPFRIPLDSLGSNVVLADDSGSYDVYVYNRYGTLLMSRYNVHPGEGGGLGGGTITSSDGSIIVTPTAHGNDLKVNVGEPSVLRAGADTIYSSGPFVFSELVREGDKVWVDNSGKIRCRVGWYHYDITVRITWAPESPRNETIPVQLYTTLASNLTDFDASYTHDNTIRLSGETKIVENGAELAFGVLGLRNGLGAELIDMGVHAICIGTAGQSDLSAGTGIVIDQGEISVDPTYMSGYATQAELTYGLAGKQDVISDLSTIRSGALAGSTAVQPSDLATVATTGDYDDLTDKPDLSVYATTSAMNTALAGKQDTISDLSQIRAGAAAGSSAVQPADLARVATTGDYGDLNNRPNLTVYATKTEVTDGLATKQDVIPDLSTIRSGAAAGSTALQPSDVAAVATSGDYADLSNKPDLSVYATGAELTAGLATKQDTISDLATIRSGAAEGATAVQPGDLATVATSGSYNDLSDKPSIPAAQVNSDWNASSGVAEILNKPQLSTVATTGDYDDLSNKPSIPAAQVNSDWNAVSGVSEILNKPTLAAVATSGSYADLSNTPSIPTATSDLTNDSGFITSSDISVTDVEVDGTSVVNANGVAEITMPTIPVTDVEVDGASVVNAQGVAEITMPTVPTATSDLTNDSGFITASDVAANQAQADWTEADTTDPSYIQNKPTLAAVATSGAYADLSGTPSLAAVATSGDYDDLTNKPSIPAAQVNSDWNASSGVAEILNKPTLATVATTGAYSDLSGTPTLATVATTGDYDDLTNKPTIPAAPVQSNWNESDSSSLAYIQNKPNLAAVATSGSYNDLTDTPTIPSVPVQDVTVDGTSVVNGNGVAEITMPTIPVTDVEVDGASVVNASGVAEITLPTFTQVQADWTEADTTDPSYIQNKPNLATVATTGAYSDLTGTPTIPAAQVNSDWNASSGVAEILNKPTLATVATTGAYSDLSGTPTIPTATSDLTNDSGFITLSDVPAQAQADWTESDNTDPSYIQNKPTLATVATSGAYSDLSGTPTLATVATSGDYADLTNKPTIPAAQVQSDWTQSDSTSVDYIKNKPNLATVATSGSYNDLTDKPSIPAAQVNADWNSSSGVSEILNKPTLATVATTGAYSDLSGTPTINNVPAVTSNDDSKVLKASYSGGVGSYSWEAESGGTVTDVEVDGTSVVSGGVASITMPTELVPTVTSNDDGKVLKATYSGGSGSYSWEAESGGTVTDVEVNGSSVVSGGVASITIPAQVQADWSESDTTASSYIENKPVPKTLVAGTGITITESSTELTVASTNQLYSAGTGLTLNNATFAVDTSVVATQTDLSGKQDTLTAGTGIQISNQNVISTDETVLYYNANGAAGTATFNMSESVFNFERIRIDLTSRVDTNNWVSTVEVPMEYISNDLIQFCYTERYNNTWQWITWRCCYTATNSGTTLQLTSNAFGGSKSDNSWCAGTNVTADFHVYKVVGIKRIASN